MSGKQDLFVGATLMTRFSALGLGVLAGLWMGCFAAVPVAAKEVPQGGYMLIDTPLPAVAEGDMIPVFLHMQVEGTQLHWTFLTGFAGTAQSCEADQKCQQAVQSLTQEVDWQEDGTLDIRQSMIRQGAGLTIDRAQADQSLIYGPLQGFLEGAVLDLDANGGTIRGRDQTEVRLMPATMEQALSALSFAKGFGLSLWEMDHCVIRQVLGFEAMADPDPLAQEVLLAARYLRYIETLEQEAFYYEGEPPAEKGFDVRMAKQRLTTARVAKGAMTQAIVEAMRAGGPALGDDEVLSAARPVFETMRKRLGDFADIVFQDIFIVRAEALVAAARFEARKTLAAEQSAEGLLAAVCENVRLP